MRRPARVAVVAAVAIAAVFASTQVAFALDDVITPTDSSTDSTAPSDAPSADAGTDGGSASDAPSDEAPSDGASDVAPSATPTTYAPSDTPDPSVTSDPTATDPTTAGPTATGGPTATDAPTTTDPATPAAPDTASPDPDATDTATPSDEASASPSDSATADPSPSATASPTDVATDPAASPTDAPTAGPTESADPTDSAVPTESADPTDSAVPTESADPTDSAVPTETTTATATASASPVAIPAIGALTVTVTSATSVRVTWAQPAGQFANTEVEVGRDDGGSPASPRFVIDTANAAVHSVDVTGLQQGGTYWVRAHALPSQGTATGPDSPTSTIALAKPAGVSAPTAKAANAAVIAVGWRAASVRRGGPAVTGYTLQLYRAGHLTATKHLSASSRSTTIGDLAWHTAYSVRLLAENVVGATASSARTVTTARPTSAQRWAAARYGSFPVRTWHGTSKAVITLPTGVHAGLLEVLVAHGGITVGTIDRANEPVESVMSRNGAYQGSSAFGVLGATGARKLRVTASSSWTVTLRPISAASSLPRHGSGDGVYLRQGGAASVAFTNAAASHALTVWQLGPGASATNLVTSGTGRSSGTVPLVAGTTFVTVSAFGAWSVAQR